MKPFAKLSLFLFFLIVFSACEKIEGDGPMYTEDRAHNNFSGIDLRISGNVYFQQLPTYKVEVTAQRNVLDVLETYVSNGRLVIKFEDDVRVRTQDDILVRISAPDLNSIRVSGSGDIYAAAPVATHRMEMDLSGSGNITLHQLDADYIDAGISGSGDISVDHGVIREERLKISGSGNMDLSDIVARTVSTNTTGSGDIRVHVTDRLDVKINGSGSVYYHGNPIINTSISGSGKVKHF